MPCANLNGWLFWLYIFLNARVSAFGSFPRQIQSSAFISYLLRFLSNSLAMLALTTAFSRTDLAPTEWNFFCTILGRSLLGMHQVFLTWFQKAPTNDMPFPCLKVTGKRAGIPAASRHRQFAWAHGLNGILADEMGLGKTIQTTCFIGHCGNCGHLVLRMECFKLLCTTVTLEVLLKPKSFCRECS